MCELEYETNVIWIETPRTARKAHQCSACGGSILPRERYLHHFSKQYVDDPVEAGKVCSVCWADRAEFGEAHGGSIPNPAGFERVLKDCIAEGDEESETRWKPMLQALRARRTTAGAG